MALLLASTPSCVADDDGLPDITSLYATELGGPVQGLPAELLEEWTRGQAVFLKEWRPSEGLGPLYNATGCAGCHFFPATGGAAQRFRDIHLFDIDGAAPPSAAGTAGEGPLRKLYSVAEGHSAEAEPPRVAVRRAPLALFGVGLWSLVEDAHIAGRADPGDVDGDGISGRVAELSEGVGRYGYKAQAVSLDEVIRHAWKEHVGLTTGAETFASLDPRTRESSWFPQARAHPANPGEDPGFDGDAVADPEVGADDARAVLTYLQWLAPPAPTTPRPDWPGDPEAIEAGRQLFGEIGCARCHVPELETPLGPVPAYTDLLLHDMGDQLGEELAQGQASSREFRTSSLLAIQLYVPYLHDSSVPAFQFLGIGHGGEAAASWSAYVALDEAGKAGIQVFLESLGGWGPKGRYLAPIGAPVPEARTLAGPDRPLNDFEAVLWTQGREKFDRAAAPNFNSGIGTFFNADSCRACHSRPALGGAGDNDLNVLLFDGARAHEATLDWPLKPGTLPRTVAERYAPFPLPAEADRIEPRNSPSIFGLGLLDRVPAATILSRHDPTDADGDGISGRARILPGGALGRFGWKAGVPTLQDFAADALFGELSMTVDPRFTDYTAVDDGDEWEDPELRDNTLAEMVFYLQHVAAPVPAGLSAGAEAGQALFEEFGCAACHAPDLGGHPAYTDLLLHDVAPERGRLVNRELGVEPGEYRTAPLWGVAATPPYLHDGSSETLDEAIRFGHAREAESARAAYEGAPTDQQADLLTFLGSL